MPANMLLGEALMAAGGPNANAVLDDLHIDRGSQRFLEGEAVQEAMQNGLTLDQLNLQAGDQIVLPERSNSAVWKNVLTVLTAVGSLGFLASRLFGGKSGN